jgi:SAM-dependent methyltransferase
MSGAEARPEPLRVPVADVTVRSSIVSGTRPSREIINPALVVVQRAVRYISDPPPAAPPLTPAPSVGPEATAPSPPPAAHSWSQPAEAEQRYAGVEVEPIDPLELDDDDELERDSSDDDDDEGEVLEVSVPPPAPPEALRRTSSNPAAAPVRVERPREQGVERPREQGVERPREQGVERPREQGVERPREASAGRGEAATERSSEPFEELELEPDTRPTSAEPARLPSPPPPPPPLRPSIPDASELAAPPRGPRVQELRPTKPRSHAWWEVFFDDDYLRTVRAPTRQQIAKQCDFIEKRLGLKAGATLLDVACGLGQHVVELTARGYASVGVDLSLAMLSRASEEAQARGMRINFLHADMRDLNFESSFDAVTCLGTSLGYFDDETNRKVMERLLRALKPGGVLLLDVVNRDHVIRSQPNLIWFEGDGCVCMEESEFNFFTSRLHVKRTVILDNGRQLENEYSLRLYSLHELGQLLNASGFRVSEVSGRDALPGVFFGQESPNLMIVAERRPDSGGGANSEDKSQA